MELKKYQQDVLSDIDKFNECLARTKNLRDAFRTYWEEKGVSLRADDDYLHEYVNSVKGVPRVTLKVPTAGGKTFIACNAIRNVFDSLHSEATKAVAWFVPYDTILKQTYKRLSDPNDPYRQRIDTLFGGRVRVYDKEALLMGNNFNPVVVREQLSIFVLSIQSFATNTKDGRRSYKENENLAEFAKADASNTPRVEGADETSLIQVIANLNPVVVVDESHNFAGGLRTETLQELNPRYVLELTATPRANSNVISFIDAFRLKAEHMVKLPVVVYNHSRVDDVVMGAINLQRSLEQKAVEAEKDGGDYIRPIVLFQAQPKTDEDNVTFEKVKQKLIDIGIPESQIKIKNDKTDELEGINLMSRECKVRYVITVDALKEGWDCPFAYILASLANRTSKISVEQILGRILRQPYTRVQPVEFLNLSYVFTCSADFQSTLTSIVESLNKSGFSPKDYIAIEKNEDKPQTPVIRQGDLFGNAEAHDADGTDDFESMDTQAVKEFFEVEKSNTDTDRMLDKAGKQAATYNEEAANAKQDNEIATDIMDRVKSYGMKDDFAEVAKAIRLPQFFVKVKAKTKEDFFLPKQTERLLSTGHLLKEFKLESQDRNINFAKTETEAVRIDLERRGKDEYTPKCYNLDDEQLKVFSEYFRGLNEDGKLRQLTNKLTTALERKYDAIDHDDLKKYVGSVLQSVDSYELQNLADSYLNTQNAFERKIDSLIYEYERKQFNIFIAAGKCFCKPSFCLPERITVNANIVGIQKSLYKEESGANNFEEKVISKIANLDNVLFWHRNFERGRGFYINGFLNHYPDFIVVLKSGKILLIEVKGDHLDGSDSEGKIALGTAWASQAGGQYRYFMVFDTKRVDRAYTLPDLLNIIRQID